MDFGYRALNWNAAVPAAKDLAHEMKLKASQLIAKLLMKGVTLTLNDFLDDETVVQLLGHHPALSAVVLQMEHIPVEKFQLRFSCQHQAYPMYCPMMFHFCLA